MATPNAAIAPLRLSQDSGKFSQAVSSLRSVAA